MVEALLLRPSPFRDPDRLVHVSSELPRGGYRHAPLSGTERQAELVDDRARDFVGDLEEVHRGGEPTRRRLMPGSRVAVESRSEAADSVELQTGDGERLSLGFRAASKIFVEPAR